MTVTTISYQKVFPLAQYINEKIGIEIQVDPDDSPEVALDFAKKTVEEWHRASNPGNTLTVNPEYAHHLQEPLPHSLAPKEVNLRDESTEIAIDNASSLEELANIKPSCTTPELMKQYMGKVKSLTPKTL